MTHKRVLGPDDVRRATTRMAHEIVERNRGAENLVVVGIERAGAVLSRKLVQSINRISDSQLSASSLDITRFRDDTPHGGGAPDPDAHASCRCALYMLRRHAPSRSQAVRARPLLDRSSMYTLPL